MSESFSPWKPTPTWLRWLGFKPYYRSRYASLMIGGGWDGFEWSEGTDA